MRREATVNNVTNEALFDSFEGRNMRERKRDRQMFDCDNSEFDVTE